CGSLPSPCKTLVRPLALDRLPHDFVHCNKFEAQVAPARQPKLEGLESVLAVAIKAGVIAVVKAKDVAGSGGTGSGFREMGMSVRGNGLHAFNQPAGRLAAPVAGDERPGDVGHAALVEDFAEPRAAQSEWRSEPSRFGPDKLLDGVRAALQLFARFLRSTEEKIRVGLGVIAEDVSTRGDFLDEIGTLADEFAYQEKSGVDVVTGQQLQKLRGDRGIGAIVEGQRQFPGGIGV